MEGVGLYSNLRKTDIPLENRIELSRKFLSSKQCFLPNKNQVIVDWLFQELSWLSSRGSRGKKSVEDEFKAKEQELEIWKLLSELLADPASEQIVLRQKILPLLFNELNGIKNLLVGRGRCPAENKKMAEEKVLYVLLCFQAITKNPNMSLTFFSKLENLEKYLQGILTCLLSTLLDSNKRSCDFVAELYHLTSIVLQQYHIAQQQQVNQHKVFTNLCEKLLPLFLLVRSALKDGVLPTLEDLGRDGMSICSTIDAALVTGLFYKDFVSNYDPNSMPREEAEPSSKRQKLISPFNQLFDALKSFARGSKEGIVLEGVSVGSDMIYKTMSMSLPFLLENFFKVTEDENLDRANKFRFFIDLFNIIASTDSVNEVREVPKVGVVNNMLKLIVEYDVYQIAEDNVKNEEIFNWLVNLMKSDLLPHKLSDAGRLEGLNIILKLNHKIIEESLEAVLAKCFTKSEEESEDVGKGKVDLLCNILETYNKLQQLEHLLRCLLKVFNGLGNKLGTIPAEFLTKLSTSFQHCSFNQSLTVLTLFQNGMKEKLQSLQQDRKADVSLERICILFITLLLHYSYNAADTHGLNEKKAASLMDLVTDIKLSTITPLLEAFPKCGKSSQKHVGFSALYFIYGLNALVLFLHEHDIIPASEDHFVKMRWDSKVKAFVWGKTWKTLKILRKDVRLKFCMNLLVIQRLRCLLLKANPDQDEFNQLINGVYDTQDLQALENVSSTTWNLDPSCVNSVNHLVARWYLVAQYAPLFIPYCNENQIQAFARFMIETLVNQEDDIPAGNLVTIHQISESMLSHSELLSLSLVQAAVVKQFWNLLGEYMSKIAGDKLACVFASEVSEDQRAEQQDLGQDETRQPDEVSIQHKKIDMNRVIPLAHAIADAMKESTKDARKGMTERSTEDLSMVARLLNVLQRLQCHQFGPKNQVRCILGSLACDVLLGKAALAKTSDQSLAIQLSCHEIMASLLQGLLQHREFSAWRVVDVASFLHWLHRSQVSLKDSSFMHASNKLLRLAVILSLKSPTQTSLPAIVDFSLELVTTLANSAKSSSQESVRCADVLFIVFFACTEFLEQKGKSGPSLKAACSIISHAVVSLANFMKGALEEDSSSRHYVLLQRVVMKLSGILTRAMRFFPQTEVSANEDLADAFKRWRQLVPVLVVKALSKIDEESLLGETESADEITIVITVLENVFKGCPEHHGSLSDELRTQILRKCLAILRKFGYPFKGGAMVAKGSRELEEAVLNLLVGVLEEDQGKNYTAVIEGIIEWSTETSEGLLTGLSVFRELLAVKVVKESRKRLRSVLAKIMVALLSRAAMSVEVFCVVLETVAALVTLGSGVFYPQDLTLVFQALAIKVGETNELFFRIFIAKFTILSWTLFYYSEYVYGAVHVFVSCVKELLQSLLIQAGKSQEASVLSSCAHKMARLYQEMTSHKDVLSKYSIYILADCVHVMSMQGVSGIIRHVLVQGVHFLFDLCNDDGITKLHVYLPSNERELFRSLKEDYMKHHKFKGNA